MLAVPCAARAVQLVFQPDSARAPLVVVPHSNPSMRKVIRGQEPMALWSGDKRLPVSLLMVERCGPVCQNQATIRSPGCMCGVETVCYHGPCSD